MAYQSKSNRMFLATSLSAALVATVVAPTASFAAGTEFPDVAKNHQYYSTIQALSEAGVVTGMPNGNFDLGGKVTRSQASQMVAKILKLKADAPATPFADVKAGAWYTDSINALYAAGFIKGLDKDTFAPDKTMTRAEFAQLIVAAYDIPVKEAKTPFTDVKAGAWYESAIETLYAQGLIKGQTATTFGPNETIKRGDFAYLLANTDYKFGDTLKKPAVVKSVEAIKDITVQEGEEVVLPKEVTVTYEDKTTDKVAVAWDTTKLDTTKPGTYALTGTIAGTELTASVKVVVEAATPQVKSVTAINATQVEVKFNKAIDADTVFANGKSGAFKATVKLTTLDKVDSGSLTGTLSVDGKTLTVTAQHVLSKRYDVVVDGVKTTDSKEVTKYAEMITIAADTTAPTITGTEQISANKVKINFSEPVKAYNTATLKYADGTTVAGVTVSIAAGATSVTVDLSDSKVEMNKPITITFIGLQDQAGNLITPNPATVTVTKQQVDGVKPTVSSVTQTGAKTFNVKFSKDLAAVPTVTVSGYNVDTITKVSDSEYKVAVTADLTGVQNVTVTAGYKDLAGQAGEAVTKVVTFVKDTATPKATSVKTVTVDGAEYLELTFDKDVTEGDITVRGSYTKDYVTTPVNSTTVATTYASTSSKKVVRTPLSGIAKVEGGVYTLDVVSSSVNSLTGIAFEKTSASFTRGKDVASNTTKLGAPVVAQGATNDTVTVTFTGQVEGASATNIANYTVDGAVVETAALEAYGATEDGKQVVTLTLKKDSNAFTGKRNITVQNVKALGSSVTMDKYTVNTVSLNENVRPTVTKAVLTSNNEITLTFSENVYDVTNGAGADFELYIGGTKATATTLATENVTKANAKNTLKLTVGGTALTADDLAKGLTVKEASSIDVKDAIDNALNFTTAAVSQ
ncbi:S-layer homology domain-containing protein [Peribacillus loiseleuriae]|uniref:S-layer homology domain-containing protein n=1 Tax=Peribacillus loiseleuriae TaxID=1679170 RepID=UPI0038177890